MADIRFANLLFTPSVRHGRLVSALRAPCLSSIFKSYGIRINDNNRRIICPFKKHKGGRESTPSFWYYPETNSFCCFGCRTGGKGSHGCEFLAALEGTTRVKAAYKILSLFSTDVDIDKILDRQDFSERLEIMMDFSNTVREFRQSYLDEKSQTFIEDICSVYDQHNLKHNPDNVALRRIVEFLKERISAHTCL